MCPLAESHWGGVDATIQKDLPSSRAILVEAGHLLLEEFPRQHEHLKTRMCLSVKVESCGIILNKIALHVKSCGIEKAESIMWNYVG